MPVKFKAIKPSGRLPKRLAGVYGKLASFMDGVVVEAHEQLAHYPPQAAGVSYRRTGTLGRSWTTKVERRTDAIVGEVASQGQIAPYNIYVQGPRQVAWAKARGWPTAKSVLDKLWPKWIQKARAIIKELA